MNPAQKALWYIESHLAESFTLDEIADIAGVSRFHLVRAFAAATGLPVMRYARARRIDGFVAQVLARNTRMMHLFARWCSPMMHAAMSTARCRHFWRNHVCRDRRWRPVGR